MADVTTVDFITLEEFHHRLAARLDEARDVVERINQMRNRPGPQLGNFADGLDTHQAYWGRWESQLIRSALLVMSVQAAYDATGEILATYRTVEELNRANAADLISRLEGVGDSIGGETVDV